MAFLNGYKTYIAGALMAFIAVNQAMHFVTPEISDAIMTFATALGLAGIGHKIDKVTQIV